MADCFLFPVEIDQFTEQADDEGGTDKGRGPEVDIADGRDDDDARIDEDMMGEIIDDG